MTRDELVATAFPGPSPPGDIPILVSEGEDVIASFDVYWRVIHVAGEPVEVAWFDHLVVESTYRKSGLGAALVAAALVAGSREKEWGVLYSDEAHLGFYESFGFFAPSVATDGLLVVALTGTTQKWPRGEIEVVRG